jgi:hypothetical protein
MIQTSQAQEQLSAAVEDLTSKFSRRLTIARAAELARAGRLLKAEALLCRNGSAPKDCEELDLLARILVRQKRFVEAHRVWRKAFERTQERERIRECVRALEDYVESYTRRQTLVWAFPFALWVILMVIVLVWFMGRWWS